MEHFLTKLAADTAILKHSDGSSLSIQETFLLFVDILSILIGIVGIIGIVIVGIQYLTSAGNEAQATKARRRLLEIVIGIAAYAATYALLKWLIPAFNPTG